MKNFYIYQFPAILWALIIFILSSFPRILILDLGFDFQDKVNHFGAYLLLGILLSRAFYYQNKVKVLKEKTFWLVIVFGNFYGLSDELHQLFIPGRLTSVGDLIADSIGIIAGALLFRYRNIIWEQYKKLLY
jgi:VanZ family protein